MLALVLEMYKNRSNPIKMYYFSTQCSAFWTASHHHGIISCPMKSINNSPY